MHDALPATYVEGSRRGDRLSFRASTAALVGLAVSVASYAAAWNLQLPDALADVLAVVSLLLFGAACLATLGSLARGHRRGLVRWTAVLLARTWLLAGVSLMLTWSLAEGGEGVPVTTETGEAALAYGWPLRWVVGPTGDGGSLLGPDGVGQSHTWPFVADWYVVAVIVLVLALAAARLWRHLELRRMAAEAPTAGTTPPVLRG